MIEEKDIERLAERDEALKRGFELVFVNINSCVRERILLGKCSFVNGFSSDNFLEGKSYNFNDLYNLKTIDWFDIQKPKMRKMTLVEIHDYLIEEKKILCRENSGDIIINVSLDNNSVKNFYESYGTLNPDGTLKPLPLVEDK